MHARAEQIEVIKRLANEKKYMSLDELMAIIAADPIERKADGELERSFAEMFDDVPGMEEMTCT